MSGALYAGTSGFAYQEWKGPFYPERLPDAGMLPYYAARFGSVEINYTFRRSPAATTLRAWTERTPEGFRFALKAHQRITHTLRLADAEEAVSAFVDRVRDLGDRLGPILFQCPPTLRHDRALIERFLRDLPPRVPYAMEFRHPSWEDARPLLADAGVAWCVADTGDGRAADLPPQPFSYLRLRKETYDDRGLARWAAAIARALRRGEDVYCYLKHEDRPTGPRYAERVARLVSEAAVDRAETPSVTRP